MLACCVLQLSPFCAAEQVLGHFRKRFVEEVNANIIAFELVHEDIIADGDQKAISKKDDAAEQSQFLHAHLVRTCTREALMTVCNVIISVKGNPKMRALGKDMKDMLEGGCSVSYVQEAYRCDCTVCMSL